MHCSMPWLLKSWLRRDLLGALKRARLLVTGHSVLSMSCNIGTSSTSANPCECCGECHQIKSHAATCRAAPVTSLHLPYHASTHPTLLTSCQPSQADPALPAVPPHRASSGLQTPSGSQRHPGPRQRSRTGHGRSHGSPAPPRAACGPQEP